MDKLNDEDILNVLNCITDDQAFDSDAGGDSDADDIPVVEKIKLIPSTSSVTPIRRSLFSGKNSSRITEIESSSCTSSNLSTISSDSVLSLDSTESSNINPIEKQSILRLRPKRFKTRSPEVSLDFLDTESDIETDDVDFDPTYSPFSASPIDQLPLIDNVLLNSLDNNYINDNCIEPELPLFVNNLVVSSSDSETETEQENPYVFSKDVNESLFYNSYNFNENFGPKCEITSSPLQIFNTFFDGFYETMIDQSNLYANQCGKNLNLKVEELKAFLGLLIIMGFHRLPSIRLYWSADEIFFFPRIASVMTQKRFLFILRFLHLNDNSLMPPRGNLQFDKLYKIRPMINHLNLVFESNFAPGRHLSCDESMVGFKGRSSLKQYMPMKPTKRGFKIWALCCSITGYLLSFIVYEGKKETKEQGSLGERTVLEITNNYSNKGYCIFFDRFFSSISLVTKLLGKKIFSCGTIMSNRKYFPKDLLKSDKTLKVGDSDYAVSRDISVCKWMDRGKKAVVTVSTMHNPCETATVKRRNKEGIREDINCPKSIYDYNKYMGGVDHFDQLLETYNISWKSRRWWIKLFYHFCDSAIVNSYILYTTKLKVDESRTRPMSHLLYRSTLANELIGTFSNRKTTGPLKHIPSTKKKAKISGDGRCIISGNTSRLQNVGIHLPVSGNYNRCRLCSTKKEVKRSKIHCKECDVALCVECFVPFHTP